MTVRVLLLAGTGEARALADLLAAQTEIETTASLAGATQHPAAYPVPMRRGGFGGADGLTAYIAASRTQVIIDATHPFARQISENAVIAARGHGCRLLRLARPNWRPRPGDQWRRFETLADAVDALPLGARVFATIGRDVSPLSARPDISFLVRRIEAGATEANIREVRARPPYTATNDFALFRQEGITHVLTRNSGGAGGRSKLTAARERGLPVFMVQPPPVPTGVETVTNPAAALTWVQACVGLA